MDPKTQRVRERFVGFILFAAASAGVVHCGGSPDGSKVVPENPPGATGGAMATGGNSAAAGTLTIDVGARGGGDAQDGPCEGLECQQTTCLSGGCIVPPCTAGQSTTVSGTVFDPAGKLPLYNVVVYVPNGPVPPITTGASCDRCDAAVANPVVATLSDTHGNFTLKDVPVGADIPLVIQVGKWRRQVKIPAVAACVDTPLAGSDLTRLPRNRSEGDIPRIAITTGGADSMECLPRRMGLDDSEFATAGGEGRIHLFAGADGEGRNPDLATKAFATTLNAGAALSPATELWATKESLSAYDIVLLSCEGAVNEPQKPVAARQAMYDYASLGGRVFASHWHRIWFSHGPDPVPSIGSWADREDPQDPATGMINTSFPKGADFADWLMNVQASTALGQLSINVARDNVHQVDGTQATEWITLPTNERCAEGCRDNDDACVQNCTQFPAAVQYLSFNTPLAVPEAEKCGRVVFTDLHVSATGAEVDKNGAPFPEGCEVRDLSSQEKAVAFMLFDLSSCIQDDEEPPQPPK